MKKPKAQVFISKSHVKYFGKRGKCCICESAYHETTLFRTTTGPKIYCRQCANESLANYSTLKFEKSDAKFLCPANVQCGAENLSFEEFFVGSCCENASRRVSSSSKFFHNKFLNQIYEESREDEGEAEIKVETSDDKVETCRQALADAEKAAKEARDELDERKKWRKKVQKRSLLIASIEMKDDNSDLENEAPQGEGTCAICMETYGEGIRQKSAIIPCGHQACYGCLSSLPQKICPNCRADFTADKILKLFPSGRN